MRPRRMPVRWPPSRNRRRRPEKRAATEVVQVLNHTNHSDRGGGEDANPEEMNYTVVLE